MCGVAGAQSSSCASLELVSTHSSRTPPPFLTNALCGRSIPADATREGDARCAVPEEAGRGFGADRKRDALAERLILTTGDGCLTGSLSGVMPSIDLQGEDSICRTLASNERLSSISWEARDGRDDIDGRAIDGEGRSSCWPSPPLPPPIT